MFEWSFLFEGKVGGPLETFCLDAFALSETALVEGIGCCLPDLFQTETWKGP